MNLEEKQIQQLKEALEKEAGEIEAQLQTAKKPVDFGSDVESDMSEEADEAEEFSAQVGVQEALQERLADIERALDKIDKGGYGVCEKCHQPIPYEVLKINPESRLCKSCKSS